MLGNTDRFLKKMEYVFRCVEGRKDACLLWRPHPLMESTFHSMRRDYKPRYDALREEFIRKNTGIYDDTPDINTTIALCDAYIGDAGTSVTSLFGMAGKPLFILDNNIDSAPEEGDWRGAIVRGFPVADGTRDGLPSIEPDSWILTQGNNLYRSEGDNGTFHHFCSLSPYAGGGYYAGPALIDGKAFLFPINAQELLVMGDAGIEKTIKLEPLIERPGAFYTAAAVGTYLFLIPNQYPAMVRYDTKNDQIHYFDIDKNLFIEMSDGERRIGGVGIREANCTWPPHGPTNRIRRRRDRRQPGCDSPHREPERLSEYGLFPGNRGFLDPSLQRQCGHKMEPGHGGDPGISRCPGRLHMPSHDLRIRVHGAALWKRGSPQTRPVPLPLPGQHVCPPEHGDRGGRPLESAYEPAGGGKKRLFPHLGQRLFPVPHGRRSGQGI